MTLKQDERALLQLICERGQSYEDLAGVLGVGPDEVRARARAALTGLAGTDPDGEVSLTDYLLGQADPIGRADAVRHLQQDDGTRALAEEIAAKLRVLAPAAELPTIPEPRGRRRREPRAPAAEPPSVALGGPGSEPSAAGDRSPRQSRVIAAAATFGGIVLMFAILAIAGVFGGDGDEAAGNEAQREQLAQQLGIDPEEVTDEDLEAAEAQRDITPVELNPQGGSGVAGAANFGLANDVLFVDLNLSGLDPEPAEESVYVIWMMLTRGAGYPVSIITPNENGTVQDRYSVPTAVAVTIGSRARWVQISESPRRELDRQIRDALEADAPVVPFTGERLAQGRIPLADPEDAEAAEDAAGADAEGGGGAGVPGGGGAEVPEGGGGGQGGG